MKKLPLVVALLLLLAGGLTGQKKDDQVQSQRKELERIKAELEIKRSSIEKLKGKEKGILAELSDLEEELELVNQLVKKMKKQEQARTKQISLRNLDLLEAQIILKQKRTFLAQRLNQVYRYGRLYQTGLLLAAESPVDFFKRYYFLEKLTQRDRELIAQVLDYIAQVEKVKKELLANLDELNELKRDKIREEQNRQKIRKQKERLLKNIRLDKKSIEEEIAQLEESSLKIQKIIESLEEKRAKISFDLPEGVFLSRKGKLPWPASGNILSTFGEQIDPKTKTVTFNTGIKIAAQLGAPVQAVCDGLVIYNSWLRGYGRFIILQHDSGFYTLYAHLGEVLVENGTLVRAGDQIALVGDSGSLLGPALHFEIRQSKQQLDPLEWLK